MIAGEGRIHRGERELLPLADGPAYFALRAGVPIIPLAINGTSWLGFRRPIRIRVGEPLVARGPADAGGRRGADGPDRRRPAGDGRGLSPIPTQPGRFGRWLTEVFNDWPEGARPALGEGDGPPCGAEPGRPGPG